MRKYTRFIALTVILSFVTLAFASSNNLGVNFADLGWFQDAKEISQEEVEKRVKEKVIEPITASLIVRNPSLLMTKCYSSIDASLSDRDLGDIEMKFYENQTIQGTVTLNRCGALETICKYQFSLNTNEVKIKESFLTDWVTLESYMTKIEGDADQPDD